MVTLPLSWIITWLLAAVVQTGGLTVFMYREFATKRDIITLESQTDDKINALIKSIDERLDLIVKLLKENK